MEGHQRKYLPILGAKRLRKIDIVSLNQATRFMDTETEKEYQDYCNRLKKLVQHQDQRIYKVTQPKKPPGYLDLGCSTMLPGQ